MPKQQQICVITFIGTHRFGIYKDCRQSESRLRESLEPFGVQLITYTLRDLLSILPRFDSLKFYLMTRYGVGAWFWKPLIIRHALQTLDPECLIYVDSDCAFVANPKIITEHALRGADLAFFSQKTSLRGWVSKRASRILNLDDGQLEKITLVTAGVAVVRNTKKSIESLQKWEVAMRNPRILLHPIMKTSGVQHRHDQSVLSALIAEGQIECNLVEKGFFSHGVESTSSSLNESWIYTGSINKVLASTTFKEKFPLVCDHYLRKLYDALKTLFIFPLHITYFRVENFFSNRF